MQPQQGKEKKEKKIPYCGSLCVIFAYKFIRISPIGKSEDKRGLKMNPGVGQKKKSQQKRVKKKNRRGKLKKRSNVEAKRKERKPRD